VNAILRPFFLPLLAVLLVAPTATARVVDLQVEAFDDGGRFLFRVAGLDGDNPDLGLRPGDAVTLTLRNTGTTRHNIAFEAPIDAALPCCLDPGESATLQFTVPEGASGVDYWCEPHRDTLSMRGHAVADDGRGTPGLPLGGLVAAVLAAALRRRP
jgi:hypothetical protein